MYLHLGNDFSVNVRDIVGIFDIENTTVGKCTKRLLDRAEREHRCVYATMDMPKSFVIVKKKKKKKKKKKTWKSSIYRSFRLQP